MALWSASGYIGAFMRASNVIYETAGGPAVLEAAAAAAGGDAGDGRAVALLALGLVLTGPIVEAVAGPLGLGDTAVDVWNIAKWPVMVAVFVLDGRRPLLRLAQRQAARLQAG